jgi:hypothetical protein
MVVDRGAHVQRPVDELTPHAVLAEREQVVT